MLLTLINIIIHHDPWTNIMATITEQLTAITDSQTSY